MERILLIAALVLGIAADAFFAIVNFYPVAPPRSRGPERQIVAEMDLTHARWFQTNVLDEFNHEHNVNLVLRPTPSDELIAALRSARGQRRTLLAILPGALTRRAVEERVVRPIETLTNREQLARDFASIRAEAMAAGRVGAQQYFLPRTAVLDLAVYRPSKVRDAVLHWLDARPAIEAALRAVNGRGLPDGYELERSPNEWDAFDQFVIGYFWAHRRYADHPAHARLAHRTDPGVPGDVYLLSELYRAGATDATIRQFDSPAAQDLMAWEALYRREGLYPESMFAENGMSAEALVNSFIQGRVFLAPVDEMEAFRIHGGARREVEAQVDDPDDLGFTAMPRAASLALDASGHPVRAFDGFSFREDAMWARPETGTEDDALAYEFLRFVWTREAHIRECEAIGILPLLTDVVRERASIFRLDWQQEIFEGALSQWDRAEAVPPALVDDGVGTRYARHWRRLMSSAPRGFTFDSIATTLRTEPADVALPPPPHEDPDAPRDDGEPWRGEPSLDLPDANNASADASPSTGAAR